MLRGPWHQCGDRSQRIVEAFLGMGLGVGVVISPHDLTYANATLYSRRYVSQGAHVLFDPQFFSTLFSNKKLDTYPINSIRTSIPQTNQISDQSLARLIIALNEINSRLGTAGVISPALAYEAGRPDIISLNERLFTASKQVGDALGIPTYATVIIGKSATSSSSTIDSVLSAATSLGSDGWYFGYEFANEGICGAYDEVLRFCISGLKLACTGLPVFHAFAGPMALLSLGFGATGVGIGHFQNLWQFTRSRWVNATGTGGGGNAPPRFFSGSLWGRIIYPDDVVRLQQPVLNQVLTHTPFSGNVSASSPNLTWSLWDANKHLLHVIFSQVATLLATPDAGNIANRIVSHLSGAIQLRRSIIAQGIALTDPTNSCQVNWQRAMQDLTTQCHDSYEYLRQL